MKMSRTMTILGLLLSLALLAGVVAWAAEVPAVGSTAPDFTLPSQEGKQVSLHDFKGKWVVLYFYPKDMTPGCTIEAHNFQRDQAQYDKLNAAVVGVSVDSIDSHQEFCTKENLTFKLLANPGHDVVEKYGSLTQMRGMTIAARNTFLVDPKGVIRKVYTMVDPNPHSQQVLTELAELKK
ncbi:MAG: peroxiredoxin [Acidobacteriia bacterium]|nr:peroxiredoxin [Terriglobia bacterium]